MRTTGSQVAYEKKDFAEQGRSPLAHLLHALNQPLTGLQCSLELAVAERRTSDQYVRALRHGLELTARMRLLVEAIRELADSEPGDPEAVEVLSLDSLLRETVADLRPVAESRRIGISFSGDASLPVRGGRQRLPGLLFRFLESALTLAGEASVLSIAAERQQDLARIAVSWDEGRSLPQYSPFSRPELGLLIACAGWKRMGADWVGERSESWHSVTVRLPLAAPDASQERQPREK